MNLASPCNITETSDKRTAFQFLFVVSLFTFMQLENVPFRYLCSSALLRSLAPLWVFSVLFPCFFDFFFFSYFDKVDVTIIMLVVDARTVHVSSVFITCPVRIVMRRCFPARHRQYLGWPVRQPLLFVRVTSFQFVPSRRLCIFFKWFCYRLKRIEYVIHQLDFMQWNFTAISVRAIEVGP